MAAVLEIFSPVGQLIYSSEKTAIMRHDVTFAAVSATERGSAYGTQFVVDYIYDVPAYPHRGLVFFPGIFGYKRASPVAYREEGYAIIRTNTAMTSAQFMATFEYNAYILRY